MASPNLIWECVKANSCFIRKSPNMRVMTKEPGNLCGLNSFKFSGLANKKVLDVTSKKTGSKETILLVTRNKKASRGQKPGAMLVQNGVKKQTKKGVEQIAKVTGASFYRRDLDELAKAKYQKIKTSFKKKKLTVKSRRAAK